MVSEMSDNGLGRNQLNVRRNGDQSVVHLGLIEGSGMGRVDRRPRTIKYLVVINSDCIGKYNRPNYLIIIEADIGFGCDKNGWKGVFENFQLHWKGFGI